jgi:hypothetical protein
MASLFMLVRTGPEASPDDQFIAQERSIKCSGDYYWGEAVGDSLAQTRVIAKKEAVLSISQTVRVSESVQGTGKHGDGPQDGVYANLKSFSQVRIQGINFIDSRRNGKHHVIAYISKADFSRSLEAIAIEVREFMRLARDHLLKNDTSSAMYAYYCAYLTTLMSPFPVPYGNGQEKSAHADIRPFLFDNVSAYLSRLTVSAGNPRIDRTFDLIAVPILVRSGGKPVSGVSIRFDNPDGSDRTLERGKTDLYVYAPPSERSRIVTVVCSISLDSRNAPPGLADIHSNAGILVKHQVNIDFSSVIGIDFSTEKNAHGGCVFTPQLKNLSISRLEWNFGDGKTSVDYSPTHVFTGGNDCMVSLTVNSSPDLTASRWLHAGDCNPAAPSTVPESEKPDNRPAQTVPMPANVPQPIRALAAVRTFQEFVRLANDHLSKNAIVYGPKTTFFNPSECFVFIFDYNNHALLAVLDKGTDKRLDLLTGGTIDRFEDAYKHQLSLWVEVY